MFFSLVYINVDMDNVRGFLATFPLLAHNFAGGGEGGDVGTFEFASLDQFLDFFGGEGLVFEEFGGEEGVFFLK